MNSFKMNSNNIVKEKQTRKLDWFIMNSTNRKKENNSKVF